MKHKTIALLYLTAALLLTACSSEEPIRIGFIGGLTGRGADLGDSGRNGAMLAIEKWRSDGGFDGRKVELIIRDDKQDKQTAEQATRELIDLGVTAIIGPMTSSMAEVLLPIADAAKVVVISPTASALVFSGKDDHFFRVNGTTRENAHALSQYHRQGLGLRSMAAAYDERNAVFSHSWLEEYRSDFEGRGGTLVAAIPFDSASGFEQVVQQMVSANPDGLLFIANAVDTAQLSQQARKLAPDLPRTAAEWAATEELLQLGGRAVEGLSTVQSYDRNNTLPRYRAFVAAYQERFRKEPSFPAIAAYDATTILLTALKRQQDGQPLRETLANLGEVEVLQQTVLVDRYGDISRRRTITVIEDNQFVVVE